MLSIYYVCYLLLLLFFSSRIAIEFIFIVFALYMHVLSDFSSIRFLFYRFFLFQFLSCNFLFCSFKHESYQKKKKRKQQNINFTIAWKWAYWAEKVSRKHCTHIERARDIVKKNERKYACMNNALKHIIAPLCG